MPNSKPGQYRSMALGIAGALLAGAIGFFASMVFGYGPRLQAAEQSVMSIEKHQADVDLKNLPDRVTVVETLQKTVMNDVAAIKDDARATRDVVNRMAGRMGVKKDVREE